MAKVELSKMIDHTLLKPDAQIDEINKLCEEANSYGFASVCVNPTWVYHCHDKLKQSERKVCTVIGFPLGATTTETKVYETTNAIENGADEIDMVINVGALKDRRYEEVEDDIKAVVEAAKGKTVKVIIETSLLTKEEKQKACEIAKRAGADFVKTSTGFSGGGATVEDIRLMRLAVGPAIGGKASGGVRSLEDANNMIEAGATRIGASAGVQIVSGLKTNSDY